MIVAKLADLDEVLAGGIFKYVRMQNGSLRFSDVCTLVEHRFMVDQDASETAVSAGTVRISRDEVRMEGYGSITLGIIRPLSDDIDRIEEFLGRPAPR